MLSFTYDQLPGRVIFGLGSLGMLPDELARQGLSRALVLSTPGQAASAERLAVKLGKRAAGLFPHAAMHVPIEIARAGRDEARRLGADCTLALGGGSTIGLAKAIALESNLPVIAIPTTYSGSEMTPIYGLTESGVKKTGRDRRVLPRVVIYDPELSLELPVAVSATSGVNAMAHCVEAMYAPNANPIVSIQAEEGIRALATSLPAIIEEPDNIDARAKAMYGAWLAGASLGAVDMGLHHKLCHTLGGSFNLPHAETHTIMLPHVAAYNSHEAAAALERVARAIGAKDAAQGLHELNISLHTPLALREIGMREADLDRAAALATKNPYANPRAVEPSAIRRLLQRAFEGRPPVRD